MLEGKSVLIFLLLQPVGDHLDAVCLWPLHHFLPHSWGNTAHDPRGAANKEHEWMLTLLLFSLLVCLTIRCCLFFFLGSWTWQNDQPCFCLFFCSQGWFKMLLVGEWWWERRHLKPISWELKYQHGPWRLIPQPTAMSQRAFFNLEVPCAVLF